jgi:hypothetical protein
MPEYLDRLAKIEERAAIKRENNYYKVHYKHILESDAILCVNLEKNGIKNYIGGNVLIEMGQAYVHDKKIFLFNGSVPAGMVGIGECFGRLNLFFQPLFNLATGRQERQYDSEKNYLHVYPSLFS